MWHWFVHEQSSKHAASSPRRAAVRKCRSIRTADFFCPHYAQALLDSQSACPRQLIGALKSQLRFRFATCHCSAIDDGPKSSALAIEVNSHYFADHSILHRRFVARISGHHHVRATWLTQ
jgi:hypothetical protein